MRARGAGPFGLRRAASVRERVPLRVPVGDGAPVGPRQSREAGFASAAPAFGALRFQYHSAT